LKKHAYKSAIKNPKLN